MMREVTPAMLLAGREQAVLQCVRIEDFQLKKIYTAMLAAASCDTHPKGEDVEQALFMGSVVPEGQTPYEPDGSDAPIRDAQSPSQ